MKIELLKLLTKKGIPLKPVQYFTWKKLYKKFQARKPQSEQSKYWTEETNKYCNLKNN
jgi:hypothetical protein